MWYNYFAVSLSIYPHFSPKLYSNFWNGSLQPWRDCCVERDVNKKTPLGKKTLLRQITNHVYESLRNNGMRISLLRFALPRGSEVRPVTLSLLSVSEENQCSNFRHYQLTVLLCSAALCTLPCRTDLLSWFTRNTSDHLQGSICNDPLMQKDPVTKIFCSKTIFHTQNRCLSVQGMYENRMRGYFHIVGNCF